MTHTRVLIRELSESLLKGIQKISLDNDPRLFSEQLSIAMGEPRGIRVAGGDVIARAEKQLKSLIQQPEYVPLCPYDFPLSLITPVSTVPFPVADYLLTHFTGRPRGLWLADYTSSLAPSSTPMAITSERTVMFSDYAGQRSFTHG